MNGFNTPIKQVGRSLLQLKEGAVTLYHLVVFSIALYTARERFKHLQKTNRSLLLHLPEMEQVWSSPELQFKVIQHTQKLLKLCNKTQCYQTWTLKCLQQELTAIHCYFLSSAHSLLKEWVVKSSKVDFQSPQNKINYRKNRNMYICLRNNFCLLVSLRRNILQDTAGRGN